MNGGIKTFQARRKEKYILTPALQIQSRLTRLPVAASMFFFLLKTLPSGYDMSKPPTSDFYIYIFVFIRLQAFLIGVYFSLPLESSTLHVHPPPTQALLRKFQIRTIHLRTR